MPILTHQGLFHSRTKENPLEANFAEEWEDWNDVCAACPDPITILDKLLHNISQSSTQEEATVAATIIQWLGSPVGQVFLFSVFERILKEDTEQSVCFRTALQELLKD